MRRGGSRGAKMKSGNPAETRATGRASTRLSVPKCRDARKREGPPRADCSRHRYRLEPRTARQRHRQGHRVGCGRVMQKIVHPVALRHPELPRTLAVGSEAEVSLISVWAVRATAPAGIVRSLSYGSKNRRLGCRARCPVAHRSVPKRTPYPGLLAPLRTAVRNTRT